MSNGNLLTNDYQFQLHNTLYGTGNQGVSIEYKQTIDGLGNPDAKSQDVIYAGQDGAYANPDYASVRTITIPTILVTTASVTKAQVLTNFKNLQLAWAPVTTDTDLAFQLTGGLKFYVNGRPRGSKADLSLMSNGIIRVLLRFDCPDPTITYL